MSEAIARYLLNPEKYDAKKGSLINYLKYHLIRSLVGNDLRSFENRFTSDVFGGGADDDKETDSNYLDHILPHIDAYFDQQIDYDFIMSEIEKEIKDDKIVENIFLGVCCYDLKRREIIEEFGISHNEYDNGIRRLKRILKKVADKYKLKGEPL